MISTELCGIALTAKSLKKILSSLVVHFLSLFEITVMDCEWSNCMTLMILV